MPVKILESGTIIPTGPSGSVYALNAANSATQSANSATSAASSSAAAGAASGRLDVGSFAELATKFVYSAPGAGQEIVAAGDVVLWRGAGAAYEVLASGASTFDYNYTGSGGVKFNVLTDAQGYTPLSAFNVPTTAAQTAMNAALNSGATYVAASGVPYALTAPVTILDGQTVDGLTLTGGTGGSGTIIFAGGASDITLDSLRVTMSDGHGIAVTDTDAANVLVTGARIDTSKYPILINDTSGVGSTLDGLIVANSYLTSAEGDAIELNSFEGLASHFVTSGVVLSVTGGSSVASGFAYGLAGAQYSVLSGAVIKESRQDAIHIEDQQRGTVVTGVSAHGLLDHAVNILSAGLTTPAISDLDPAVVTAVHATHEGTKTGFYGANVSFDTNGPVPGNVITSSFFQGFDVGAWIGGSAGTNQYPVQIIDAVSVNDCNTAVEARIGGIHVGEVASRDTPTLARAQGGARIGKVISQTQPTAILSRTADTSAFPGPMMRGWAAPFTVTHTTGSVNHNLIELPTRALGRLYLSMAGANRMMVMADISWDGTTLTVSNEIRRPLAAASTSGFEQSGGVLQINVNSTTASANPAFVEFDGFWYQE